MIWFTGGTPPALAAKRLRLRLADQVEKMIASCSLSKTRQLSRAELLRAIFRRLSKDGYCYMGYQALAAVVGRQGNGWVRQALRDLVAEGLLVVRKVGPFRTYYPGQKAITWMLASFERWKWKLEQCKDFLYWLRESPAFFCNPLPEWVSSAFATPLSGDNRLKENCNLNVQDENVQKVASLSELELPATRIGRFDAPEKSLGLEVKQERQGMATTDLPRPAGAPKKINRDDPKWVEMTRLVERLLDPRKASHVLADAVALRRLWERPLGRVVQTLRLVAEQPAGSFRGRDSTNPVKFLMGALKNGWQANPPPQPVRELPPQPPPDPPPGSWPEPEDLEDPGIDEQPYLRGRSAPVEVCQGDKRAEPPKYDGPEKVPGQKPPPSAREIMLATMAALRRPPDG